MNMHVGGAKAQFKVGQRVVPNSKGEDLVAHWSRYWAEREGVYPGFFYITRVHISGDYTSVSYSVTPTGSGPIVGDIYLEPAPAFAVGDKVRFTDKCEEHWWFGPHTENKEGVVRTVDGDGDYTVTTGPDDDYGYVDADELELLPTPAAPKFKVGDRVRCINDDCVEQYIYHGGIYEVENLHYVDAVGGPILRGVKTFDQGFLPSRFELVAVAPTATTAAATLTIRAGKYYRTRDGRRVGPMRRWDAEYWEVVGDEEGRLWTDDGTRHFGEPEEGALVAEWQDAPAAVPVVAEATTAKFKVGDRVDTPHGVGTVVNLDRDDWPLVDHDTWHGGHDGDGKAKKDSGWWYTPDSIKATPTNPAIVCLIENGQPKPATYPHVHASRKEAMKEAERLARSKQGQEFGVYELVASRKEERVYAHEWQRLAKAGRKLDAIRELRRFAGLGLATSKAAVEDWLDRN